MKDKEYYVGKITTTLNRLNCDTVKAVYVVVSEMSERRADNGRVKTKSNRADKQA